MDIAVDDHSRLGSTASASPDLDAGQSAALDRGAEGNDGRVAGVASLEISQELEMVCIWVVGCEP
jgi:hypothetical protein